MGSVGGGTAAVFVMSGVLLGSSSTSRAQDKIQGTFKGPTQEVTLSHGFAWIDGKHTVSVAFFGAAPNAKEQARAMQDGGPIFGVFDAPNVTVRVDFKEGATRAETKAFAFCHILYSGFAGGPFAWNSDTGGCGLLELGGDLKPGGTVHGKLKGQAEAMSMPGEAKRVFAWDVDFTVVVRAKP
ncbi:MAG TPA: hypothetical protein VN083_06515 [Vicinamibacteria bacterium]|jgi:hypothetical protein|nr:hypothetical protein [Vicinamibacteria bacterium]